jgi:threonine synthase
MGLPIHRLIIATNRNDILARCLKTGTYGMEGVTPTISPSMDIQISSNFERLLFDLYDRDASGIATLMQQFRAEKRFTLTPTAQGRLQSLFAASSIDDNATRTTIRDMYETTGELLDPHSAVGVAAGRICHDEADIPLIVLATAHPAKFPDAVKAASGVHPALPAHLADLHERPERFEVVACDAKAVKRVIEQLK